MRISGRSSGKIATDKVNGIDEKKPKYTHLDSVA